MAITLSSGPNLNITNLKSQMKSPHAYITEAVLFVLLGALFWWFILSPKQAAVDAQAKSYNDLQTQESQIKTAVDALNNNVAQLDSDQAKIALLDQALPLNDNTVRVQLLVNSIAQSSGVAVGSITVSGQNGTGLTAGNQAAANNPFGPTRTLQTDFVSISVSGTFQQILSLFNKLENSGRLVDVTEFSLSPVSQNILSLQATAQIYSLAPSANE